MLVGVPKEVKVHEYRVGLVPGSVRELVAHGHQVMVETGAGRRHRLRGRGLPRRGRRGGRPRGGRLRPRRAGGEGEGAAALEWRQLRRGQTLFTYLHLAADRAQAEGLVASGCTAIAYETVTDAQGALPLLAPMSEVAGRMSVQVGAHCLEKAQGGAGVLLGGVPGVPGARVAVLGGGVVGSNAARIAGRHARASPCSTARRACWTRWTGSSDGAVATLFATREAVEQAVLEADLVIGAVLVPGAAAPRLVTRDMVARMRPGSVMVDVAIDQGGCFETSRPTTHAEPTYVVDGVVHYCVTNMPGAVARTSAVALNNATLPYTLLLADRGVAAATAENPHLAAGVNVQAGRLRHPAVIAALGEMI
jgi:alanine dehydrogenase